jgi:hypothetical protein
MDDMRPFDGLHGVGLEPEAIVFSQEFRSTRGEDVVRRRVIIMTANVQPIAWLTKTVYWPASVSHGLQ